MGQWSENKVWRLILAPSNIGYKYLLLPRRLFGKAPVQQPNLTEQNSVYERNRRKFVQVEVHSEFESLLLAENEGHAAVTQTRSRSAQTFPAAAHSAVAARCCSLLPVAACCCLLLSAAMSADTTQSSNLLLHVVWWRWEHSDRWLAPGAARNYGFPHIFI